MKNLNKSKKRFWGNLFFYKSLLIFTFFKKIDKKFTIYGKGVLFSFIFSLFFINFIFYTVIFQITIISFLFLLNAFVWTIYFKPKLIVKRSLPKYCTVSKTLEYTITIENYGKKIEKGLFFIECPISEFPLRQEYLYYQEKLDVNIKKKFPNLKWFLSKNKFMIPYENAIPNINPSEKLEITVHFKTLKRGFHHFKGFYIIKKDPFSLMKKSIFFKNESNIISLPKIYPLETNKISEIRKYNQGGIISAAKVGNSEEFISLKDYKPGDIIRRIHWKSFAKTKKLIVKEFNDEFFSRYGLILDTFSEQSYNEIFEEAVSVAASIIHNIELGDSLIDLIFLGSESYIFTEGRSVNNQEKMLEILSAVSTSKSKNIEPLTSIIKKHITLLSSVIIILIDIDEKRKNLIDLIKIYNINTKIILIGNNKKILQNKIKKFKIDAPITIFETGRIENINLMN